MDENKIASGAEPEEELTEAAGAETEEKEKETEAAAEDEAKEEAEASEKADEADDAAEEETDGGESQAQDGNNDENQPVKKEMSPKEKRALSSVAITALVLVAVILLNILGTILTDKFSVFTADITSNSSFNISAESRRLAQGTGKKVTISFLSTKNTYQSYDTYFKQAVSIAEQLSKDSGGMISVEYIDLVQNPTLESKYPDETLTTTDVIVSCGDKYNILSKEDMYEFDIYSSSYQYITSSNAEQALDEAIMKVTSDVVTKVALIINEIGEDFEYFVKVMKANNYEPIDVDIEKDELPEDCNTVILLAPMNDYSEEAVNKLDSFLTNDEKYGRTLISIPYKNKSETPNIDGLMMKYGLAFKSGLVFDMDTNRLLSDNYYAGILTTFASKLYSGKMTGSDYPVLVSFARPVVPVNDETFTPLLKLSDQSGFCDYQESDENWSMQDAVTGNVYVVGQGIYGNEEAVSTVIAAGSSLMFGEAYLQSQYSNQTYILNMLADINGRKDDSITLEKKVITKYDITAPQSTKVVLGVIFYAVIPLLIIISGFIVFFVRRRR